MFQMKDINENKNLLHYIIYQKKSKDYLIVLQIMLYQLIETLKIIRINLVSSLRAILI